MAFRKNCPCTQKMREGNRSWKLCLCLLTEPRSIPRKSTFICLCRSPCSFFLFCLIIILGFCRSFFFFFSFASRLHHHLCSWCARAMRACLLTLGRVEGQNQHSNIQTERVVALTLLLLLLSCMPASPTRRRQHGFDEGGESLLIPFVCPQCSGNAPHQAHAFKAVHTSLDNYQVKQRLGWQWRPCSTGTASAPMEM